MVQFRRNPVRVVSRNASSLATGNTPGRPRQTGQTWVFGGAPNSFAHPHHIFEFVLSWTWVSNPMTASYPITPPDLLPRMDADEHGFFSDKSRVGCSFRQVAKRAMSSGTELHW